MRAEAEARADPGLASDGNVFENNGAVRRKKS